MKEKDMEKEIWRPVKDYEGYYEVSNLGQVRSLDRITPDGRNINGKILIPHKTGSGYKTDNAYKFVGLCKFNKVSQRYVHTLVAQAFPEICGKWFEGAEINHKNELKWDNRADNIEVITRLYNLTYNNRHLRVGEKLKGRVATNRKEVLVFYDGVLVGKCESAVAAGRKIGVSESAIRNSIYGRISLIKEHYTFKYADGTGEYSEEHLNKIKTRTNEIRRQRYAKDEEYRNRKKNINKTWYERNKI